MKLILSGTSRNFFLYNMLCHIICGQKWCTTEVLIQQQLSFSTIQVKLLQIFSQFGLVYEVQVIDSSDSSEGNLVFLHVFLHNYLFVGTLFNF